MRLSSLNLRKKVFLAPMAGANDPAFRLMCSRYGSALNFTDMISAKAVTRNHPRTLALAATHPGEGPVAIQLYGSEPGSLGGAIQILEAEHPDTIRPSMFDLNLGCPVPKIMDRGAGCALFKEPAKLGRMVAAMRSATDLPVSVKMRLGLEPGGKEHLEFARIIERNGADLLVVHARYCSQKYAGEADWTRIREVVEAAGVPVVGNGDVRDGPSAVRMMEGTGCDCVMVGRAALGDPHVFRRIGRYMGSGRNLPAKDRAVQFREYFALAREAGVRDSLVKKHAMYFTRGMEGGARLRERIKKLSRPADILRVIGEK